MGWWSLIAAALAQVVIGFLWYGLLFGKTWQTLTGMKKPAKITSEIKRKMSVSIVAALIMSFVTAYIMKITLVQFPFVTYAGVTFVSLLMWLGFVLPVTLSSVLWEGRKVKLFVLNSLYYLASLVIVSWILLLNF